MSISIITTGSTTTITLSSAQRQSLEAKRLTILDVVAGVLTPRYADIDALLIAGFYDRDINQSMANFSSTPIGAASIAATQAKKAYIASLVSGGATVVDTIRNLWPPSTQNVFGNGFNTSDAEFGDPVAAPDGTTTAMQLSETNPGSGAVVHRHYLSTDMFGGQHTISMFLKARNNNWAYLDSVVDTVRYRCWFDLTPGAGAVGTNTFPSSTPIITPFPNDWYRCSITFTAVTDCIDNGLGHCNADAVFSYTAVAFHGVDQWGQQFENGSLTDYQPISGQ